MRRLALLALAAALAAGCGAGETKGTAAVWITRDRGAHVLRVARVPAGLTAMQALRRVADVKTRYGGRFVKGIDGLQGSLSARRDWFYFVNGYEADRGAAEYRLHPGDVEWWDYRSWSMPGSENVPVVVGAFPEPFLHGYGGKRLPAVVVTRDRVAGMKIAKLIGARRILSVPSKIPPGTNAFYFIRSYAPGFIAQATGASPGSPVSFLYGGPLNSLLDGKYRYRYSVP